MGIRILIIEAENRFRNNLCLRLLAKGFTVYQITPQENVINIVAKERIDVVLLGVETLGLEGLALIEPIKTVRPGAEIIIIKDAGHVDFSIEAMELGAFDDFLFPLDIESLAKRIRDAVVCKKQKLNRTDPVHSRQPDVPDRSVNDESDIIINDNDS